MADDEKRVIYKAIADFSALSRAARNAKKEIAALRREEAALNAESAAGSAASAAADSKRAKARKDVAKSYDDESNAASKAAKEVFNHAAASKEAANATSKVGQESEKAATSANHLNDAIHKVAVSHSKFKKDANGVMQEVERDGRAMDKTTRSTNSMGAAFARLIGGAERLNKGLEKLGDARSRGNISGPWILLIPVFAGLLALINPLVAGLGALGAAALGFADSLGRVAVAAIGVVPALAAVVSVVAAMKVAFGGIGTALKAFSAMKKATGAGAAPQPAVLSQQEEITRAQEKYVRSIQDVQFAEDDLNTARKDYIKRLTELQKAVDRAAASEARAAANSQLAREQYANVLADPGSTKGQKMDAQVGVQEALQSQQDTIDQNKQNAQDLADMKKKGMEGDRQVIQAQRALTDAIWAQRDAQLALINAQNGSNRSLSAAASATNEYNAALAKLSPSARKFVEILISMQGAWDNLQKAVQESFFSKFVGDMGRLKGLLPSIKSLLVDTAGAVGDVARNLLLLITSPKWERDLMLIGKQNVPIIHNVGDAVVSLTDAFKDLVLIAGPFLTELTVGLKEGAANFAALISHTRETGALAAYLEEVRATLQQWWRIVKNIGVTLFNYGAASKNFGNWLTTGFEKITEGWRKASEAAKQEGSPFQQYLEDIKPLLSEVKGLFADFFGWFKKTSMDKDNIKVFTDIIHMIRVDLGPALSKILDMLAKSHVGEGFVQAIVSIVDAIATLLQNGGVEGIKAFYDVISVLFKFLDSALQAIPAPVIEGLVAAFGALAAMRFLGITKLLDGFIKLAKAGSLTKILDKIKGTFSGLGDAGAVALGGDVAGATVLSGGPKGTAEPKLKSTSRVGRIGGGIKRVGGGIGGLIASVGLSFLPDMIMNLFGGSKGGAKAPTKAASADAAKGVKVLGEIGKTAGSAGKNVGKGFSLIGSIAKGAGRGAGVGALASIVGSVAGDLISSSAAKGGAGSGQRVGGNVLAGAASGAGIGALVGSVVPVIGTGIGAAAGGAIGAGVGLATSSPDDLAAMVKEWGNFFRDMGTWIGQAADAFGKWLTVDLPGWFQGVVDGFYHWLSVDLPSWLGDVAGAFYHWLSVDLPSWLGDIAGSFWRWLTVDMPAWLGTVWTGFMNWLTVDMPAWLATVWNGFMTWLTVDLPGWLAQAAQGFWKWLTVDLPGWIGQASTAFWHWLTVDLPAWIGQAANNFSHWLTVDLPNSVVEAGKAIGDGFTNFFKDFFKNTGDFFSGIGKAWNDFWGSFFGNFGAHFDSASKGEKGDVPGGIVGPTIKKVEKLLPAGMHFSSGYRTPAENKAAGGSPTSLHMDKNNPAVDIVGSKQQMNAFARILGAVGGWRQLYYNGINAPGVGHWPGHDNHIHVANTGGRVPGAGNGDTVPSLLTPGEFVIKKSVVNRVGAENLRRFNAGVMSYAQLLQNAMSQPGKGKGGDGGFMFGGGGLVPGGVDFSSFGGNGPRGPEFPGFSPPSAPAGGFHVENLIVNNPEPEPASDSLPRSIRKIAYLGTRK